ncbi:hypothetical protein ASD91_25375 [Pseudomonas sp. Root68]|nr:hypothetical protein ASD91_25375 [Pseudomonas sp. Root68]KRB70827.1 hypothetical protein ASD95_23610 [Pseudomonas sp. Root71]
MFLAGLGGNEKTYLAFFSKLSGVFAIARQKLADFSEIGCVMMRFTTPWMMQLKLISTNSYA